jgi:hypothetical protein
MSQSMGILISSFDYSPVAEDEFHDWYDTEHIPERERIPGFLDCTRWLAVGLPKVSVTTYELASIGVLRSQGYLAVGYENNSPWTRRVGWRCIKRLRFEGIQATPGDRCPPDHAAGLVVFAMNAAPGCDDALARLLDEEHVPQLARVAGVACVRRFRATSSTHQYVLTCHLDDPAVTASSGWKHSAGGLMALQRQSGLRDLLSTSCVRYRRRTVGTS